MTIVTDLVIVNLSVFSIVTVSVIGGTMLTMTIVTDD